MMPPFVRPLIVCLVAVLALGGALSATALIQSDADGDSPAQGHAQVIAHGVAPLPATEVAWRVVLDEAGTDDTVEAPARALGFALADDEAVLVNDFSFGTQTRLAAGEASFVADGAAQQRLALGDAAVDYYRIALVPTEQAEDDGGAELVLGGDGFSAPDGNRDLDLVRDVLDPSEETELAQADAPILLLVTAGNVEVTAGDEEAVELEEGEAATFDDDLAIAAAVEAGATIVAAVIGPEVPPLPAAPVPTAAASPAASPAADVVGSIGVAVFECPPGTDPDDLSPCVDFAEIGGFSLTTPEGAVLTLDDANFGDGGFDFSGLPAGVYNLTQTLAAQYDTYLAPGFPVDSVNGGFLIEITAETPDIGIEIYNLQSAAEPVDTDGDSLTDDVETDQTGTDPADFDSDDDGLSDGQEAIPGGTATDPLDADSDGDGFSDGDEVAADTDPLDPASFPPAPTAEATETAAAA